MAIIVDCVEMESTIPLQAFTRSGRSWLGTKSYP
jgi:hypothetical protein